MKVESKKALFVKMTPAQAATINGGKHGADDRFENRFENRYEDRNDDRGRRNDDIFPHF